MYKLNQQPDWLQRLRARQDRTLLFGGLACMVLLLLLMYGLSLLMLNAVAAKNAPVKTVLLDPFADYRPWAGDSPFVISDEAVAQKELERDLLRAVRSPFLPAPEVSAIDATPTPTPTPSGGGLPPRASPPAATAVRSSATPTPPPPTITGEPASATALPPEEVPPPVIEPPVVEPPVIEPPVVEPPSEIPSEIPSELPTDLPSEVPSPLPTDLPTAVPVPTDPPPPGPTRVPPPTNVPPPTVVPPTAVPGPTAVPTRVPLPTAVPPTAVPPTAVPPTAVPPTAVPPTAVPPTAVPPTAVPPIPTDTPVVLPPTIFATQGLPPTTMPTDTPVPPPTDTPVPPPTDTPVPPPTDTPVPLGTSAFGIIQAENLASQQGLTVYSNGISFFDGGDWARYSDINFGAGVSQFQAMIGVTSDGAGQFVDVRIDSPSGPLIASLSPTSTGAYSTMTLQSTGAGGVTGLHDLYLVARGSSSWGVGNIDWFTFLP